MRFTKEQIKDSMKLYAVTDSMWLNGRTLAECVKEALDGGATFMQIREKELPYDEFVALAKEVKEVCDNYNVPYVVNDEVQIAKEIDADGVHIGQSDEELTTARKILGPDKIIGVSAQTVEQAILAEKNGADYLGVGSIFSTSTKLDADDVSLDTLRQICEAVSIPVVAIGGISLYNIPELKDSKCHGAAVVSAIFANDDIKAATKALRGVCDECFGQ